MPGARNRVVVMALIPGRIQRGGQVRSGVPYGKYGRVSWEWWCKRNGVHFVTLDQPIPVGEHQDVPPSIQRWGAPPRLLDEFGPDTQIAVVDADTMIRWDTPNFFDAVGDEFAAVLAIRYHGIYRSVQAHQALFPGVTLPWWEYFNSGFVVMGPRQVRTLSAFMGFVARRWPELREIQRARNVMTDQTPLNFFIRQSGDPIRFLTAQYNLTGCFPHTLPIVDSKPETSTGRVFSDPETFDFVDFGYIWHFTNVVRGRVTVMAETWKRVAAHYPGAQLRESGAPAITGADHYNGLVGRVREIVSKVVSNSSTVLVASKGDETLLQFNGCRALHFPQNREGCYSGYYPANTPEVVESLEDLWRKGAEYLVLPQTAFWWTDHYDGLAQYLDKRTRCVWSNDDCIIYQLTAASAVKA